MESSRLRRERSAHPLRNIKGDMATEAGDGNLQLPPINQGLFNIKKHWDFFQTLTCLDLSALPRFLLSCLFSICFTTKCSELLLLCTFGLLIDGAHAEDPNEDFQSCICADPNVWEIRDFVLKAVAVTIFAGMTTIGVGIAGRMFNLQPLVPEIQAAVAEIPAIPAAVQALPIIPVVEGDDVDDVLARAPTLTRLNSPLSWL